GYSASKWASEIILREAHDHLGLPVSVFRPSEIMAHSEYRGQVNAPDFFTRLLAGIVYTGLAPRSFYASTVPQESKHLDGLPVEPVARSIVVPSVHRDVAGAPSYETYHVVNSHVDDGVSLDTAIAWVKSGGYDTQYVADYESWYR